MRHRLDTDATVESDSSGTRTVPDRTVDVASGDTLDAGVASRAIAGEGEKIGRFVVERELGRGGMGTVLAAHDPTLGRKVAIKLLHDRGAAAGSQRLLREAQALARLAHPNVVAVHEIGETDNGVFVAMEYVDGETLRDWMTRPHDWHEIVDVFVQAGRGLAAAHAAGLVHRDFKPENVLIRRDGRVQVTDFGLASVAGPASNELPPASSGSTSLEQPVTRTGALLGTPAYMSPEQHERSAVGPASDQFSFCVALFEALFGTRPFAGPDYLALASQVTSGQMRAIPSNVGVPRHVSDALLRGLRTLPTERYESMTALLRALAPVPPKRRTAWLVAAAAVVAAGSISTFALFGGRSQGAPCAGLDRPLAGAWDPIVRASVARTFAATGRPGDAAAFDVVAGALDRYSQRLTAGRVEACTATHVHRTQPAETLELRNACLDRRTAELAAYTATLSRTSTGAILDRIVEGARLLPRVEDCADIEWLRKAGPATDRTLRALIESLHGRLATARNLQLTGEYAEANKLARAVVEESAALHHPALRAAALYTLGSAQEEASEPRPAEVSFRAALRAAAEAGDNRMSARLWARLIGNIGSLQGRSADALALREAAEVAITAAGNDLEAAGQLYNALGNLHAVAGDLAASKKALQHALEIREQAFGPDHGETGTVLNNLGLTLMDLGETAEARKAVERAKRIYEANYGPDHPNTAMALDTIGLTYWAEGKLADARKFMEDSLARRRRALGEDALDVARSRNNLGNVLLEQGDAPAALPHLELASRRFEAILGPEHPDVAGSHANLANVYVKQQRWEDARREAETAVRGFEKALGPDHNAVAYALVPLGVAYVALGRPADAIAPLRRAIKLRATGMPRELAEAKFELAKALDAAKQDHAGALALARAARPAYVEMGASGEHDVAKIDAWLAARR